jgi:hypothetical protein
MLPFIGRDLSIDAIHAGNILHETVTIVLRARYEPLHPVQPTLSEVIYFFLAAASSASA